MILSTPPGCGWFYRLFRRGQHDRDPGVKSWAFASATNPHLDAALIEAERSRLPPDAFAEQYEAVFVNAALEPCDVCDGPTLDLPSMVMIDGPGRLPSCPDCGEPTNEHGRTVVHLTPSGILVGSHIELLERDPNARLTPLTEADLPLAKFVHAGEIESVQSPPEGTASPTSAPTGG